MNGEHPFNQSRGTNMKQTRLVKILAAGSGLAQRRVVDSARAADHDNYDHDTDPVTGTTTTQQTTTSSAGTYRDIHAGFGLLHVPNSAECGTSPLLLRLGTRPS